MKIDVHFTLTGVDPATLADATVVVIDVVRATTTIVEALANGAGGVFPTASTEEAVKLAASLGREDALLCGERKGVRVEGFDLGNSPGEFSSDVVTGKKLVMSTTNGTRALVTAAEAELVVVCAFTNLGAVSNFLSSAEDLVIVCAGRQDHFSYDDALCAGHLIRRILDALDEEPELGDAAMAARTLAGRIEPSRAFLSRTAAGRGLAAIGLENDLDLCVEVDRHDIVPEMRDQTITVAGG